MKKIWKWMTGMKIEEAIEELKSRQIPTEWLEKVKNGYKCIGCGNGSGKDGTGAVLTSDGRRLLCGKCGKGFSYIDVAAKNYGIDLRNFVEGVKEICQKEGVALEDNKNALVENLEEIKMATNILEKARNNLKEFMEAKGGEWRGLTYELLKRINWGFSANFAHPKTPNKKFPAVIIPNDKGGLFARGVNGKEYSNIAPTGTTTIYLPEGTDFDLVIVEGAINGASILQAIPEPKFGIMASGGTSGNENVVARLKELYPAKKPRILIAYDDDSNGAGTKAAVKLRERLVEASFTTCTINITQTPDIDVNDVLNASEGKSQISGMIQSAMIEAQKEFLKQEKEMLGENSAEYYTEKFKAYLENRKIFAERKTGFENIDEEAGAFLPGVYIVGGLAALGKTSFCWQLLEQAARQGENGIYASYEMSAGELYSKRIARAVYKFEKKGDVEKALTTTQISRSKFYEHRENFEKVLEQLKAEKISLRVWELEDTAIEKLFERIEKFIEIKDKPPVVVIDYLQILAGNVENVKTAIDDILRRLKNFQRATNTTFIVISSLNRANYGTEISFESFKESGGIEYSADVVWGLQLLIEGQRNHEAIEKAKKEIPRQIQLKCLKNRNGKNYDVGFFYYPQVDLFEPMEEYGSFKDYKQNASGEMVEVNKGNQKKKIK